jgi:hypothetical protein
MVIGIRGEATGDDVEQQAQTSKNYNIRMHQVQDGRLHPKPDGRQSRSWPHSIRLKVLLPPKSTPFALGRTCRYVQRAAIEPSVTRMAFCRTVLIYFSRDPGTAFDRHSHHITPYTIADQSRSSKINNLKKSHRHR